MVRKRPPTELQLTTEGPGDWLQFTRPPHAARSVNYKALFPPSAPRSSQTWGYFFGNGTFQRFPATGARRALPPCPLPASPEALPGLRPLVPCRHPLLNTGGTAP